MLLVKQFMETFLLLVEESSTAQMVQKVQNGLVSVPEVLLGQNLQPEFQNSNSSDSATLGALQDVSLKHNKKKGPIQYMFSHKLLYTCSPYTQRPWTANTV